LSQQVRQTKAGPANGKPARRKKGGPANKKNITGPVRNKLGRYEKKTGPAKQSRPGLEKGGCALSNKQVGQHCTSGLSVHSNALYLQALLLEKECLALPLMSGSFS